MGRAVGASVIAFALAAAALGTPAVFAKDPAAPSQTDREQGVAVEVR